MSQQPGWVYMDYAATSAVRPPEIAQAMYDYVAGCGATPGRGGHRLSTEAGRVALRCRMLLARMASIPGDPGRIVFTLNATYALNKAIFGILNPGDVVVHTAYDHNAVLRPVHEASRRGVGARMLAGAPDGSVDLDAAARALDGARLLVLNATSNVLGTNLPVRDLARMAHDAGALVLVDAAQTLGHGHVDVQADGIDILAFTGHKGLLGPQGVGGLWIREGLDLKPMIVGGTGGNSRLREMPESYPDRLEAGSGNGPGLAGLLAALQWVAARGAETLHDESARLKAELHAGLSGIGGVRILSPLAPDGAAVVTVAVDGVDSSAVATRLDREFGILVRSGLHCAPEVHKILGTENPGAVRFSLGWASTREDIERAVAAMEQIALVRA